MIKILLLSVLVVAMIGLMVPSIFAESYDVIKIKDPDDDPNRRVLSGSISLYEDTLLTHCDGDLCIFDANTGKMKKILRAESFSEYSIKGFSGKSILVQDRIFANFLFEAQKPSYVCSNGIAMIDANSGNLLKIFQDEQLSGYYGKATNRLEIFDEKACSVSYGVHGNFKVFENYLLVGAPSTFDTKDRYHPNYNEYHVIQQSKVFLYDTTTGNLIHTFEDLDKKNISDLPPQYSTSVEHEETFTTLGRGGMAINENYILLSNKDNFISSDGLCCSYKGEVFVYDTKTRNHLYTIPSFQTVDGRDAPVSFGSTIVILDNDIFIADSRIGKVHKFSASTGQHVLTLQDPTNSVYFGGSMAISENLFLVSGPGGGSDSKGRIGDGGVVFLFDKDAGDIIKEFRNADPNPGFFRNGWWYSGNFGAGLSISGDKFVIGAPGFSDSPIFVYSPIDSSKNVTPTITVPNNMKVSGNESTGTANVDYTVTAKDYKGNPITVKCNPSSGSLFFEGTETITCTASDVGGNTATATFKITVGDSVTSEPEPTPQQATITPDIQKVPDWVRNVFIWYAEDRISENELLDAIKFLVNQGIIDLDE